MELKPKAPLIHNQEKGWGEEEREETTGEGKGTSTALEQASSTGVSTTPESQKHNVE